MSRRSSRSATATTWSASATGYARRSHGRPIHAAERIVVAALGDSITEGSPEYDARYGGDEKSQWEYWAARADPRLLFRNCGAYGERTDEIALRLDTSVAGADVLIVQGGINDIAQGYRVDLAAANLRAMVQRGKELGPRVAIAGRLAVERRLARRGAADSRAERARRRDR